MQVRTVQDPEGLARMQARNDGAPPAFDGIAELWYDEGRPEPSEAARQAAESFPEARIVHIDSRTSSLALGLGAGLAARLLLVAPPLLIEAIAGLALFPTLAAALTGAMEQEMSQLPALVTLLVVLSGISIAGVGAPLWGLLAGGAVMVDCGLFQGPKALQALNRVDPGHYQHAMSMGKPYTRQAFGEQHPSDPRYAGYEQYVQEGPPNKKRKRQEVFGNARDAAALRDQAPEDEDMPSAPARQRRQGLDHEVPIGATYATNTVSVSRSQLNSAMKSKLDMYNILAIEGQLYLPPFQDCTMDFIKQLVTGQKKVSPPLPTM